MIVAPSRPLKVMSWPSMLGSLAGTDNGLRATGAADGEAAGEAAGDATGRAAAGDAAAAGDGEAAGLATVSADGLAAGEAAAAAVGFAAALVAGALVGAGADGWQPMASSSVAVDPIPPVMLRTRRTMSRRERWPAW